MKPVPIKTLLNRRISASRRCVIPENAIVTTATLPFFQSLIKKHLKRGDYIAVATPGECYHCHHHDDLRCGVCFRCVDRTYTDGVWCWHQDKPKDKWAIPELDHVLGRIR